MTDDSSLLREASGVLADLDERTEPAAVRQRRRTVRHACRLELRVQWDGEAEATWALTRDLSAGGLACVMRRTLPVAAVVRVRIPLLRGGELEVQAQVTHSIPLASGWHLLGLMFLEMVDPRHYVKAISACRD